jgi:hypothetical protein
MRAPIVTILAAFALAGCVSGTRTIVVREYPAATPVPAPRPIPAPLPTPRRLAQLEVALGNPAAGKVPVQTNRAAYIAIFEIIPQQGVTLLHPSTPKQSRTVMSGLSWVSVVAGPAPTAQRVSNSSRPRRAVRYIYALASDTPLRIPDRAIEPGYLEQLLGPAAFRAASPQAAVRAISRNFAPKVSDEQWAEDLFAVEPRNSATPPRVARVYCWNGRMYEVPEDMADRAWCPERPGQNDGGVMPTPARPDSVVGNSGRRIGPRVPRNPGRTADMPEGKPEHPAKPDHPAKPEHPSTPRNDQAEKEKKEKAERDAAEKEQKDKAEKEKADKDRADKEREEKEKKDKADKKKADHERAEKEKKDKADKDKADHERAEKEKKDKADHERAEKEKKDKADRERAEKEKAEKEKKEKDEADKAEREKAEKDKAEKEKAERETAEKQKADKAEREKAEKEKADKTEREKAEKEKADKAADSDDSAKDDKESKPDEADKGAKDDSKPSKDADRKPAEKSKSKADSSKSPGSPNRGRSTP